MRSLLVLASLAALTVGCGGTPKPKVGVIPRDDSGAFWPAVHAGAVKAGREAGFEIEWAAPSRTARSQSAMLESMVNRHFAGVVLAPDDAAIAAVAADSAQRAGIPVVLLDAETSASGFQTVVSFDYAGAGKLAAEQLGEFMRGDGTAAILGGDSTRPQMVELTRAFEETIRTGYPRLKLLTPVPDSSERNKAQLAMELLLTADSRLAGLFAMNAEAAEGAALALRASRTTKVRVVAFGGNANLAGELRDRFIDLMVLEDPMAMGYESVRSIGAKLKGETPAAHVKSPVLKVDRSNLEDPDVVRVLYPDLSTYLGPVP